MKNFKSFNSKTHLDSMKKLNLTSIYFFNDYIFEFDIINGNNYIAFDDQDQVYVCGYNQSGGLGLGHKQNVPDPLLNNDLSFKGIYQFFRGYYCMFAKNEKDEIYCLGLGKILIENDIKPTKNEYLSNKNILNIYCGREGSAALTKYGQVLYWLHVDMSVGNHEKIIQEPRLLTFPW